MYRIAGGRALALGGYEIYSARHRSNWIGYDIQIDRSVFTLIYVPLKSPDLTLESQ